MTVNSILTYIFDMGINLYQSSIIIYFLVECLGINKLKTTKTIAYFVGISAQMAYLIVLSSITAFENFGIFIPIIILIVYSNFALEGSLGLKFLFSISIILIVMMSTLLSGSIIGIVSHINFVELVSQNSTYLYIATIFTQIIIFCVVIWVLRLKKKLGGLYRTKELILSILIPLISILTVTCIIEITNSNSQDFLRNLWFFLSIIGIIIIDIMSYFMFGIVQKQYKKELEYTVFKASYDSEYKNIDDIRNLYLEAKKIRHDLKNYVTTTKDLLNDEKYDLAKKYLKQFEDEKIDMINQTVYTQNVIMDLIINRKFAICEEKGIATRCFITGTITDISDVDISILMGNLLDNAIEASVKSEEKTVGLEIYAQNNKIEILVMNSSVEGALHKNSVMTTTKTDDKNHGYGIMNINDVIKKYNGEIKYKSKFEKNVVCKVILYV